MMSQVAAQELVIDTDPGTDDAHALLMAASHPGARIHAICTVHGNVPLGTTTRNALAVAELAGIDAPIYPGADRPLTRRRLTAADVHGADGLGGRGREPERLVADTEHAAHALVRLAREHPYRLTYVTLGPLTNLALALSLVPGRFHTSASWFSAAHAASAIRKREVSARAGMKRKKWRARAAR